MTLKDQIIEAYRQAVEPREIADRFGCAVNYATAVICTHKRQTGEVVEPASRRPRSQPINEGRAWDMPAHDRRMAFFKRARAAANQARMAEQ